MRSCIMRMAAAAAVVSAVAIWPASAQAQVVTHSTKTVVYGFGGRCPGTNWSDPMVRPGRAWFSLPCENGVRRIHWQDWGAASASGHGTILLFNGTGFTPQPGTISLSTVRMHHGQPYFAHLVMKWTTKDGAHHKEVLNWKKDGTFWLWIGNYGGTSVSAGQSLWVA